MEDHGARSALGESSAVAGHDEYFRLALEASPTGMIMVDSVGRIVLVNAQVEKLFGYERRELVGAPIEVLVPERLRTGHPHFRGQFFANPKTRPMGAGRDLHGLRKDGTEVPVEIGLNPLVTAQGTFVLSSVVDITERKRAQLALEEQRNDLDRKNREREVLLKEVYHRVKNNLQVISSLLNLQASQVTDSRSQELLEEACNRVHAIALVHEQLYQSTDLARVNFSAYVTELVDHLRGGLTGGSDVEVQLHAESDTLYLPVHSAIPAGLILTELITNALKHAFTGRLPGRVTVQLKEPAPCSVSLSVMDDGRGLPANLDVGTASTLGLELVGKLAKQLRAKLDLKRDHGTRFDLMFTYDN
jgi:PAS domain S-box-containing protein